MILNDKIPLNSITVEKRLRNVNPQKVAEIAESIKSIGLINPISVDTAFRLIAGLHRLEALKSLGETEAPVTIYEIDSSHAELIEIDENLIRQELTVLEQSEHIARREQLLEEMGLRARSGFNGNRYTN